MDNAAPNPTGVTRPPGEEAACLQIAVGILGLLLLIIISLLSRWHWSVGNSVGVGALLSAMILLLAGGFAGLKARRQPRAAALMLVGDIFLTTPALIFLVVSFGGGFSWAFPLGSIFTTMALFSDIATHRFRRAQSRRAGVAALGSSSSA